MSRSWGTGGSSQEAEELEKACILFSPNVGVRLLTVAYSATLALNLLVLAVTPTSKLVWLGPIESMAVLLTFSVQLVSLLQDVTRQQLSSSQTTRQCLRGVKTIAAITNLWLYMAPTPFVTDHVTGRPNSMLRWAEWSVLAVFMTFLVDAADATEWRQPLITSLSQGLSTLCGLALPYIENVVLWYYVMIVAFVLFFYIFVRLYVREIQLVKLQRTLAAGSYELLRARTTTRLLRNCCVSWTILVFAWTVDAIMRIYFRVTPEVNWGFIVDCVVDVATKLLYASVVNEYAQVGPVLYGVAQGRLMLQRLEFVWNDATDVIIVSVRLGDGSLSTCASPSCSQILSADSAEEWILGRSHGGSDTFEKMLARDDKPKVPARDEAITFERLVACGWWHQRFSCTVVAEDGPAATGRVCDVSSSVSETADGCVIIVRDVTDRDRVFEIEREVLSASIERIKDEEANRFSRHEVKNGVLAAISQVDALKSEIRRLNEPVLDRMLRSMRTGLSHTLETILSQAMARDVLHGNYVPRSAPCRIDEVLGMDETMGMSDENATRFPISSTPEDLPIVDLDRRLLSLVHHNAVSNACKYGKRAGTVLTEIELRDNVVSIRVINEPGPSHAEMVRNFERQGASFSSRVFAKGTQLHTANDQIDLANGTARVSKGDGGWIMKKCADALQGEATIRFEPERTVFELTCPAPTRLDESFLDDVDLSQDVYALGVDDCEFQRMVLGEMLKNLGVPAERIQMLGSSDDEIRSVAAQLVALFDAIPSSAYVLLIIDENLDLSWPNTETVSGSYAAMVARSQLSDTNEARLLALVRSSNDSEADIKLYSERTHGFLCKATAEPDRAAILRLWVRRLGFKAVTLKSAQGVNVFAGEDPASSNTPAAVSAEDSNKGAAAAELGRLTRLLDHSLTDMPMAELWKWLHRVKGVICAMRPAGPPDAPHTMAADDLICTIEQLRARTEQPADMAEVWAGVKALIATFASKQLGCQAEFEGATARVRAGLVRRS